MEFVVLLLLGLFLMRSILSDSIQKPPRITCSDTGARHEWTFNNSDKLQCCLCNKVAGEESNEPIE